MKCEGEIEKSQNQRHSIYIKEYTNTTFNSKNTLVMFIFVFCTTFIYISKKNSSKTENDMTHRWRKLEKEKTKIACQASIDGSAIVGWWTKFKIHLNLQDQNKNFENVETKLKNMTTITGLQKF